MAVAISLTTIKQRSFPHPIRLSPSSCLSTCRGHPYFGIHTGLQLVQLEVKLLVDCDVIVVDLDVAGALVLLVQLKSEEGPLGFCDLALVLTWMQQSTMRAWSWHVSEKEAPGIAASPTACCRRH